MSMSYIPMSTPDVASIRKNMLVRIDDETEEKSLLTPEQDTHTHPATIKPEIMDQPESDPTGADIVQAALKENGYNPAIATPSSVGTAQHDITELDYDKDPALLGDETPPTDILDGADDIPNEIPAEVMNIVESTVKYASDCGEYFTEAAMKAKVRNKLPDSEFGIPRLRKYPLNDEKHVRMAISMFSHCKDPKDKAELARRIFTKIKELKIDIKIGKNSALYDYAPKALQEAVIFPILNESEQQVFGMETPIEKRTKEQIQKDHLNKNSTFYNSLFFGKDYAESIKAIQAYTFLDFFYPSFKTHNFYSRIKTALGGIATNKNFYQRLGLRYSLDTDTNHSLTWYKNLSETDEEQLAIDIGSDCFDDAAWFHVNTAMDMDHVKYCLGLYSILGMMVMDQNFDMNKLSENHIGILTDWSQQVVYNWDMMQEETPMSQKYMYYAQRLHDLFWDCCDNPLDPDIAASNVIAFVKAIPAAKNLVSNMNEATELISKEDCIGYMVHELGMEDDMFLLPATMEYPIINPGSVRLAMDMIVQVDAKDRNEYAKNLNRKYKELGCDFAISVDHPYAKYADQNIIDHMNRILMEGKTTVSDQGTSTSDSPMDTEPWYKRLDVNGNVPRNLLNNKEFGPNDKKYPNPDYSRYSSVF